MVTPPLPDKHFMRSHDVTHNYQTTWHIISVRYSVACGAGAATGYHPCFCWRGCQKHCMYCAHIDVSAHNYQYMLVPWQGGKCLVCSRSGQSLPLLYIRVVKMCRAQSCSGLVESDEAVATYLWLPSARRQFDITSARYPLVNMLPL